MSQKVTCASRKRAPNFSREEQLLLCSIMEPYMHILENKKTDDVKQHLKRNTWSKISDIYNANTKCVPRSTENLLACYRNMKSKLKKQHSSSKMSLKDSNVKDLLCAIEENDKDWEAVADQMKKPSAQCQEDFESLKKEFKEQERKYKKAVLGTGGGPPPSEADTEPLIIIKKMLEPQIDGLYTLYDADANLMTEYQESLPEKERIMPIEHTSNLNFDAIDLSCNEDKIVAEIEVHQPPKPEFQENDITDTPKNINFHRQSILKKRKSSALTDAAFNNPKKKSQLIQTLAAEKLELVQLQKNLVQMEMEHKKNIFALELQMKQKELVLIDLKIKKFME